MSPWCHTMMSLVLFPRNTCDQFFEDIFTLFLNGSKNAQGLCWFYSIKSFKAHVQIHSRFALISFLLMPLRILILMIIDLSFGETKRVTIFLALWFCTFLTFIKRSYLSFALMKMFCYLCDVRTFSRIFSRKHSHKTH